MRSDSSKQTSLLKAIMPSGVVSVCVHITIVILAGISLRGCESGVPVEAGGAKFRTIGLAVIPDDSANETDIAAQNSQDDATDVQPSDIAPVTEQKPVVPTEAPSIAELLGQQPFETDSADPSTNASELPNIIGPGVPIGGAPNPGGGLPESTRPKGISGLSTAGSPNPGPGETTFMNIVGNGRRFAYVIDTSASMATEGRLELAKSQLKGSLRLLQANQKFQVLFYNESTVRMKLRKRPAQEMYVATAVQVQLAGDEISRVVATGGTEHKFPIITALTLNPDVVYFLTDGATPRLTREDLAMIRSQNRSGAKIHVIEFAVGPRESRSESWMQLLARQSGGTFKRINLSAIR